MGYAVAAAAVTEDAAAAARLVHLLLLWQHCTSRVVHNEYCWWMHDASAAGLVSCVGGWMCCCGAVPQAGHYGLSTAVAEAPHGEWLLRHQPAFHQQLSNSINFRGYIILQ